MLLCCNCVCCCMQVRAAEGVSKALQAQLQEAAQRLKATTADYDEQVGCGWATCVWR
jgi:hypothetical protein